MLNMEFKQYVCLNTVTVTVQENKTWITLEELQINQGILLCIVIITEI